MAFVETIRRLWQRKLLVLGVFLFALAVAILSSYRVGSSGLEKRSLSVAAASGQILVDNAERPNSTKGIEAGEFEALETRAKIYAQYLAGYDAKLQIAKEAGISPKSLATTGPYSGGPNGQIYNTQSSEERTQELVKEGSGNQANFTAQEDVPIITVSTQAANTDTAVAIASASFDVLNRYIRSLNDGSGPVNDSIVVHELGAPEGGEVGGSNNMMLMALAFIVVFGLGCALILAGPTFAQRWRALSEAERDDRRDERDRYAPSGNGSDDLIFPPYSGASRHRSTRRDRPTRREAEVHAEFNEGQTEPDSDGTPVTAHHFPTS